MTVADDEETDVEQLLASVIEATAVSRPGGQSQNDNERHRYNIDSSSGRR